VAGGAARLLDSVRRLNQSLDPSRVLVSVCEEAVRLLDAGNASVFLADAGGSFRLEATYGTPAERIGELVPAGEGLVGTVVERNEPAIADGALAVPLSWGGRLRGVLAVGGVGECDMTGGELELLADFGELAAAACRNAGTHSELALAARTDALTGCLNHAAMHEALIREFERCSRHGQALSLAIVDLDDFKQVNERHGHLAGDEVLRRVGHSLRQSVRAYDLVARYGGDEFAIIAVDAGEPTASEVALRAVDTIRAELDALGAAGDATGATAGVAEWRPGDTPATLIARADTALLRGKHEGGRGSVVRAAAVGGGTSGRGGE
jgi:diguanylate cyclase (GGDEF)-like protein